MDSHNGKTSQQLASWVVQGLINPFNSHTLEIEVWHWLIFPKFRVYDGMGDQVHHIRLLFQSTFDFSAWQWCTDMQSISVQSAGGRTSMISRLDETLNPFIIRDFFFFFFWWVNTEDNILIRKKKPRGQSKAFRKYTVDAIRLRRAKRREYKKPHLPSPKAQPIKKVN